MPEAGLHVNDEKRVRKTLSDAAKRSCEREAFDEKFVENLYVWTEPEYPQKPLTQPNRILEDVFVIRTLCFGFKLFVHQTHIQKSSKTHFVSKS